MTGDTAVILTTERLVLRRLRIDEADAVAEYKNDPQVARYQDWDLPYPVEEIAAKIAAYEQRPWPCLGAGLNVAIEHEGALIGDFGVGWDDEGTEAEIGYTLRVDDQGGGLATEAVAAVVERLFSEGVERITSSLDPENVASIRVLENVGFNYEASSRIRIRGALVDDDVYAIERPAAP
ncbi:MAG: GNAT family N-acetyltransferase [Ilumatobacteraceae bacterium]